MKDQGLTAYEEMEREDAQGLRQEEVIVDVEKARRLIAAVSLANVRLLEASAKTRIRLADLTDDMHPQYTHFARASSARLEDGVFYVIAALELKILSASQGEGFATLK